MSSGTLRNISETELELMLSWRNMPNIRANMYTRHEISLSEHLIWWEKIKNNSRFDYKMYDEDGAPLGIVGFVDIDRVNSNSSWAFYAAPHAPKGTGSKMEFLAIDYAFSNLNLKKLHCEVLDFNKPVIRLHEKFGFTIEGILRQHHLVGERFADIYKLGLLDVEWQLHRSIMLDKFSQYRTN